ncbi:MAG: glycoside hydrolase, partial [Bacteroidales bacterium]|nr:glycoside hydrolase [Bacteroidales bacterium]
MKNLYALIFAGGLVLLTSCQTADKSTGNFNLLPVPRQMEVTGASGIHVDEVLFCFSADGSELPVLGATLSGIKPADNQEKAQVVFRIDPDLDLEPEGYTLEISGEQIAIAGKDRAGLLYGFMTLEQLMEDAGEQGVPLPLCSIQDCPLLSYRAIHLDMKHHLEKTEYYYKLMDKLAHYKVNAIIAEVEDKLGYQRQPVVASEDALGMEEWKKLSDYAMERNV